MEIELTILIDLPMKNYISAVILFPIIYLLLYLACLLPNTFTPLILNTNGLDKAKSVPSMRKVCTMEDCFIADY